MPEAESLVDRDAIAVLLRHVPDEVRAIRRAWSELEDALGSLRGRKFYGSFDPTTSQYAVCVVLRQGDDRVPSVSSRNDSRRKCVRVRLKGSHRPFMTSSRRRCRASRTGRTATRSTSARVLPTPGRDRSPSSGASFVRPSLVKGHPPTLAHAGVLFLGHRPPDRGAGGVAHWRERPRVPGNRGRRALAERGDVQPDPSCTAGRRRSWRRLEPSPPASILPACGSEPLSSVGCWPSLPQRRCSHHLQRLPSQPGGGRLP